MSDIALLKNVPLSEIMSKNIVTVSLHEPFGNVYDKMSNHRIRHLPVVDEESKVIGIVTQRDLFRAHAPRETEEGWVYDKSELNLLSLEHFMTHDPVTLTAERKLSDALDIFVRDKFGCIPIVTADKKIAGVISHSDILKYFLKGFA